MPPELCPLCKMPMAVRKQSERVIIYACVNCGLMHGALKPGVVERTIEEPPQPDIPET